MDIFDDSDNDESNKEVGESKDNTNFNMITNDILHVLEESDEELELEDSDTNKEAIEHLQMVDRNCICPICGKILSQK